MLDEKAILRRQLRRARQALPRQQRLAAECAVNRMLCALIKRGKRIAVYYPIGSEMRLDDFIRCARQRGAKLYLPYIERGKRRLWFTPYIKQAVVERRSGSLNIPQCSGRKMRAHGLQVMVLPMVGIDRLGYRLGQGGGFYDTTLAARHHVVQPYTVAVGFACQQVATVWHEAHDYQVHEFISEKGRQRFRLGKGAV